MREFPISQITIQKNRFRKELGNIEELAESIRDRSLLQPIVIDEKGILVAGRRRLLAYKKLGRRTIPVRVVSLENPKLAEIDENTKRKDFTPSEIAEIADYVESTRIGHRPEKGSKLDPLPKGKTNDVVAKITGVSHQQVQKIKTIKKAAKKEPKKFGKILEKVDKKTMSVDTAHKLVTRTKRNLPKAKMPAGKFDVILCDVPIGFNSKGGRGAALNHYETMTPYELMQLEIPTPKNAIMFFWMSPSIMYDTIEIIVTTVDDDGKEVEAILKIPVYKAILDAWGFEVVKGEFVWDKEMIGMGSWNRNKHENCLIAIKGTMPTPAELYPSLIREHRTKQHSKKPEFIYDIIEKMYPKRQYLELFARQKHSSKWAVFGNQVQEPKINKSKEDLQQKCKCKHPKIYHDGKGKDHHGGSCAYRSVTCGCEQFTPTTPRRKVLA